MSKICHQEELWAKVTDNGRDSLYHNDAASQNHLDMFYGNDSNSSLMEDEETEMGGGSMHRTHDNENHYSAGGGDDHSMASSRTMGFGGTGMSHY